MQGYLHSIWMQTARYGQVFVDEIQAYHSISKIAQK